jgi:hypothetical protein
MALAVVAALAAQLAPAVLLAQAEQQELVELVFLPEEITFLIIVKPPI